MSMPADKLARRVDQLTAVSHDVSINCQIMKIDGVLYFKVEGGKVERLGTRDLTNVRRGE